MDALASLIERLPAGSVSTHHGELFTHARDRWALTLLREARGARVPPPSALVFPRSTQEVAATVAWAAETRTAIVPRGAGTGLHGGAQAIQRAVVLDMSRMNRVLRVDDVSQAVTAEGGARGADVEAALGARGLSLGHYLPSVETSTVGGWIATASSGAAAAGFGTIGEMVLGATFVLGTGETVRLEPAPATAAGPNLARLLVGSEGAFAIVTEATLAATRAPSLVWEALSPHSFDVALTMVREIVQRRFHPVVVEALDEDGALAALGEVGHERGPVVVVGVDARAPWVDALRFEVRALGRDLGARLLHRDHGEHLWARRGEAVAAYDGMMGPDRTLGTGVATDWLELVGLWRSLPRLYEEVRGGLLDHAERVECRLVAPTSAGAMLSFRFVIRADDDEEAERVYREAWRDAGMRCQRAHGTLTFSHGVGVMKTAFVRGDVGDAGLAALRRVKKALDPRGILNPGKLLPPDRDARRG